MVQVDKLEVSYLSLPIKSFNLGIAATASEDIDLAEGLTGPGATEGAGKIGGAASGQAGGGSSGATGPTVPTIGKCKVCDKEIAMCDDITVDRITSKTFLGATLPSNLSFVRVAFIRSKLIKKKLGWNLRHMLVSYDTKKFLQ